VSANPAGCYGKLPIFADFIRHNYRTPEVEQLDQWFQEGIYFARQSLGGRWEAGYDKGPSFRFLFRPSGSAKFLIGAGAPGADKVGRRYPFAVFMHGDCFPESTSRCCRGLPPALDAAQELASGGWKAGDVALTSGRYLPAIDASTVNGPVEGKPISRASARRRSDGSSGPGHPNGPRSSESPRRCGSPP
jgi:type VI secretion system ImpM family protein